MTSMTPITFAETDLDAIAEFEGRVAVVITPSGKMGPGARRANRLTKGALKRLVESASWEKAKPGDVKTLAWPTGMAAEALDVLCHERGADAVETRKAGAALAKARGTAPLLVLGAPVRRIGEFAQGLALRSYAFTARKSDPGKDIGPVTIMVATPAEAEEAAAAPLAIAEGVLLTRDLVSEPANHLTTTAFAERIQGLEADGLKITVLEEDELEKLGMGLLLSVGQGSATPTKVAVMEWSGGRKGDAPLALVGKGVVFDTGGISIKPAGGMEEMTMDMGGAGTVVGTMKALAKRRAKANVVGLVGLVENMPSGSASRPGDVVTSMKGDTVEIINTDAEGRLLLADVLWYAQEKYEPAAVIDLATLTGAIIVALGHEHAGVFSNDDSFADKFLRAAGNEGEGAWRMPLGEAYDKLIKSNIADMKNVGGRKGGAITAAQFLQRYIKDGTPWIHLDIAGAARVDAETSFAPKGATGWGVMSLNRLISDQYEGED
ncbi:leucyl aminopeptidase [Roseovarius aestuariivivens]|uniref:leucyl aminopeptidase n=1 Tax=Roseovarius aestuariivivens TaxID=1888910 RepID=UPI0010819B45|nr:leucyl aminopeptidase [Roseovarius aestuariivivens]